jgi:hypothetical protein
MYNINHEIIELRQGKMVCDLKLTIDQEIEYLTYLPINELIKENQEFKKYKNEFKYFKVKYIAVTVIPNEKLNQESTYINIDWLKQIKKIDDIKKSDSTRVVRNDLKSEKQYYFKLPNRKLVNQDVRKYNDINKDLFGVLYMYQKFGQLRARVDARVMFRKSLDNKEVETPKIKQDGITHTSFSIIQEKEPYWLQLDEDLPKIEKIKSEEIKIDYKKMIKKRKNEIRKERRKKKNKEMKARKAALENNKKIKKLKDKYKRKLDEVKNKEKQLNENKYNNEKVQEANYYQYLGNQNFKEELKREAALLGKYKENVHRREEALERKFQKVENWKRNMQKKFPEFNTDKNIMGRIMIKNSDNYNKVKINEEKRKGLKGKYKPQSNKSFSYQVSNKHNDRVYRNDKKKCEQSCFDESLWYA